MDFELNEEQLAIKEAASDFAKTELLPKVIDRDIKSEFPKELIAKMAEMGFMGIMVPKENRIGEEGFGFKFAMETLNGGRIGIAAQALGIAAGALELSVKYAKERKTFGKPISEYQAIQFKLADMDTEVEAARLLCYKAALKKDKSESYVKSRAIAKLYSSKVAMKTTIEAVQIHGGYGYVREYHVERRMRDAKITQIYEGTSEIQKIIISRKLLS